MNLEKLRKLWDGHAKAVYAYLLRLTRSEADAKDFLQDVFWQLARQPALLDRLDAEPRGYLLRQARNLVVDQARRGQVRERVFAKINALRNGEAVDGEDPDNRLIQRALANALRQLPEEQRAVVHARLWKKQTLDSIAGELGISINTAGSRYRYGLDKLREHLRSLYEDLAPRAASQPKNTTEKTSKTTLQTMKEKSNIPFNGSPEEPLIQALEQRRVPSGTGFALPVLPIPEDGPESDAEVDPSAEVEGELFFEKPDIGLLDGEGIEGELILLEEGFELPVSFNEVFTFGGFDDGGGEDSGNLYDLDVKWAAAELYGDPQEGEELWIEPVAYDENGLPVEGGGEVGAEGQEFIKYMTFGLPVEEGTGSEGEWNEGEVVKGEVADDSEPIIYTFGGGIILDESYATADGKVDSSVEEFSGEDEVPVEKGDPADDGGEVVSVDPGGEMIGDGEVFVKGPPVDADGEVNADWGGYVTENGEYVGFNPSWVIRTLNGEAQTNDVEGSGIYEPLVSGGPVDAGSEGFDPSLVYATGVPTAGGEQVESPAVPEALPTAADRGNFDTAQHAAAIEQLSATAEAGSPVVFFANEPAHDAAHGNVVLPTAPIIELNAAPTSHEFAAFVPGAVHHGPDGGAHEFAGASASEVASGRVIGQWIPVGDLSSEHTEANGGATHGLETEHADAQAIAAADAGAVSSGGTAEVRGSSAAVAVTGAAMLARDVKAADRKKRE